jgi:hypothetical protein
LDRLERRLAVLEAREASAAAAARTGRATGPGPKKTATKKSTAKKSTAKKAPATKSPATKATP